MALKYDWDVVIPALEKAQNILYYAKGDCRNTRAMDFLDDCIDNMNTWIANAKPREEEPVNNSRKLVKSDFDDDGYWTDDEPKSVKQEERHGKFERPNDNVRNELRPQIEDALDNLMYRKKFGLDKDVYDETVDYVIDLFGEEYPPKNAEEAVQEWYADTKRFFPEMFGKGEKRKVASSLYLKKIRSSRMIKSGRR